MTPTRLLTTILLALTLTSLAAADLTVFQGLDEMTARIPRLKDKPFERLLDKQSGWQPETLMFKDTATGAEIWSLTFEECTETANIERRCPWNCDGSIISLKGNRTWPGGG